MSHQTSTESALEKQLDEIAALIKHGEEEKVEPIIPQTQTEASSDHSKSEMTSLDMQMKTEDQSNPSESNRAPVKVSQSYSICLPCGNLASQIFVETK